MPELPPIEERQRILDGLAALIATYGPGPFVAAPLVEPTIASFPEGFRPGVAGVRLTARRLLHYAKLHGLRVDIAEGTAQATEVADLSVRPPWALPGAPVWLDECDPRHCAFKVDLHRIGDHGELVGALAREVARAFRAERQLGGPYRGSNPSADADEDEPAEDHEQDDARGLVDLTAVYLGLGVVASYGLRRFSVDVVGYMGIAGKTRTERIERACRLPPESLAFAVAAQAVARGLDDATRERLALALQREHSPGFRDACAVLSAPGALDGLGLPPRADWPPAEEPGGVLPEEATRAAPAERRASHPVFRVAQRGTVSGLLLWLAFGFGAGIVAAAVTRSPLALLLPMVVGSLFGALRGQQRTWDECSSCLHRVPDDAPRCPKCDGVVAGSIENRNERLDAEEKLLSSGWKAPED